jgi:5-methylcytosine-specific restriction endonuclease McrA
VLDKSHRAVEQIVSQYREPMAYRDSVRPVGVTAAESVDADVALLTRELARLAPEALGVDSGTPSATVAGRGTPSATAGDATPGAGSGAIEQKYLVRFVASEEMMAKLEEVKALLSHRCKEGTFADVLGIVLKDFLERHSPEARHRRRRARQEKAAQSRVRRAKLGGAAAANPCAQKKNHSRRREYALTNLSRHIPAAIHDEVFVRDGVRCSFVARNGIQCGSRQSLQVDHIRPFAAAGTHDPCNLRLLCAAHNRLAAEQTLGEHVMRKFWRKE